MTHTTPNLPLIHHSPTYFASSNSSHGFASDYPTCFGQGSGVDMLYIIKGGPGTGKSRLMHHMAQAGISHGYTPTYYACSSDPYSLDGVRLDASGRPTIALVDGTPPHVLEPTLAGVSQDIVNLGMFWDTRILGANQAEISSLTEAKTQCYHTAYHYLKGAGESLAVAETTLRHCLQSQKLARLASRLTANIHTGKGFLMTPAHTAALGMRGWASFDSYQHLAQEVVIVKSYYGVEYALMDMILSQLTRKKCQILLSRHPVHTHQILGIFEKSTATAFVVSSPRLPVESHPKGRAERVVDVRRYVIPRQLGECRGELRHALKLCEAMEDAAEGRLRSAAEYHFRLEEIYQQSMDFGAKERYEGELAERIFAGRK